MSEKNQDPKAEDAKANESTQANHQVEETFQTYPSVTEDGDPGPTTGGG